jgi:hypothetical protein
MHIKTDKKHIFICLFLCFLFLASYISVFNTSDIIASDLNISDVSFGSREIGHSSMAGEADSWHFDYMSPSMDLSNLSALKNTRSLVTKTIFNILTAIISTQIICLFCTSRFSQNFCTPFNSIRIIFFLHKKDGMK